MVWLSEGVLGEANSALQTYQPSPEDWAAGGGIMADGYDPNAYQAPAPTADNSIDWNSGAYSPVAAGYDWNAPAPQAPQQAEQPQWLYDSPGGGVYSAPGGGNYVGDNYYAPGTMPDFNAGMEFQQPTNYGPVNPNPVQDYGPVNPYFPQDYGAPAELASNPMRDAGMAQIPQAPDYTRRYETRYETPEEARKRLDQEAWLNDPQSLDTMDPSIARQNRDPGYAADQYLLDHYVRGTMTAMSLNETLKMVSSGRASIEWLPDGWYDIVDAAGSPLSLATVGGGSIEAIAGNVVKNTAATALGLGAQEGTQRYGETNLPGSGIAANPWVQNAVGIAGGAVGYGATEPLLKGLGAAGRSALDLPENLAKSINPPPGYDARMIAGAIDPETGMPFATQTFGGGADITRGPGGAKFRADGTEIPKHLPNGVLNPEWTAPDVLSKGDVVVSDAGETLTVARDYNPASNARVNMKNDAGETVRLPRDRVDPIRPDVPNEPSLARAPETAAPVAAGEPPVGPPEPPAAQQGAPQPDSGRIGMGQTSAADAFGMGRTEGGRGASELGGSAAGGGSSTPGFARDLDPNRFANETPVQRAARENYVEYLGQENNIQSSGTAAAEIHTGRQQQLREISAGRRAAADAGMTPTESAQFVLDNMTTGGLRQTVAQVPEGALLELDHLQSIIDSTYRGRDWDWLNATKALQQSVESGALEPQQRQILEAVLGDQMPIVDRAMRMIEGSRAQATTMPLDLGGFTKPGQPPLIGEQGGAYLDRWETPADVARREAAAQAARDAAPGPASRIDAPAAMGEAEFRLADAKRELADARTARDAARTPDARAEGNVRVRQATTAVESAQQEFDRARFGVRTGTPGTDTSGPLLHAPPTEGQPALLDYQSASPMFPESATPHLPEQVPADVAARNQEAAASRRATPLGQNVRAQQAYEEAQAAQLRANQAARRAEQFPEKLPDGTPNPARTNADIEARMAQSNATAKQAAYDRARGGVVERDAGQGIASARGPELRTTTALADQGANDLVLRGQTVADADLGVVPIPGQSRSVAYSVAAKKSDPWHRKVWNTIADSINLTMSTTTGIDISAAGRQGLPLGTAHPIQASRSFKEMIKAGISEEAHNSNIARIRADPHYAAAKAAKLFLGSDPVSGREEAFASRLLDKIPSSILKVPNPLKASERAYVSYLDTLRFGVFVTKVAAMERQVALGLRDGIKPKELQDLAEVINHATGRGTGKALDALASVDIAPMFSARNWASKPQLIANAIGPGTSGVARAEAAKILTAYVTTIAGIDALAVATGVGGVNLNPRDGKFGELKIGRQSYDLTGGFAGLVRDGARFVTEERTNAAGVKVPLSRGEIAGNLLRSKLSPAFGVATDILTKHDYDGRPIDFHKWTGPGSIGATLSHLGVPLVYGDIKNVVDTTIGKDGIDPKSVALAIVGILAAETGISVQSDNSPYTNRDDDVKRAYEGKTRAWDDKPVNGYWDLDTKQRKEWDAKWGTVDSFNSDTRAREKTSLDIRAQRLGAETKAAAQYEQDAAKAKASKDDAALARAGDSLRGALADAALVARTRFNDLYKNSPEYAKNPDAQALSQYFETFGQALNGYGKVDYDKQQELYAKVRAGWSDYQKKVVDDYLADRKSPNPTIQALYDAQNKIGDSGFWDAKSKTQFRLDNPEIDQALRDYGYSDTTGKAVKVVQKYDALQQGDDAKLKDQGPVYAEKWRNQLHDRQEAQRDELNGVYGDSPDRPATNATDAMRQRYYQFINTHTDAYSRKVDWDAVDNWVAQEGPDMQAAIDSIEKRPVTPTVQAYRDAAKAIADKGYWDTRDDYAKEFATIYKLDKVSSYTDLRNAFYNGYLAEARAQTPTENAAFGLANWATDKALSKLDTLTAEYLSFWRLHDPELLNMLVQWGYYTPSKDATKVLLGLPPPTKK